MSNMEQLAEIGPEEQLDEISTISDLLVGLGALAHQLQLERGCSALYIDSEGELFEDNLLHQYSKTDSALFNLTRVTESAFTGLGRAWKQKYFNIANMESDLAAYRISVQKLGCDFTNAMNTYTHGWLGTILEISIQAALYIKDVNPVKVSAYSNFLQWKERAGRERAWGARGFHSDVFKNQEFAARMISLIEEQEAYRRAFNSLATTNQRKKLEKALWGFGSQYIAHIHQNLLTTGKGDELPKISGETWFDILTGKINRMALAEHLLIGGLNVHGEDPAQAKKSASVPKIIQRYLPLIKTLPAFMHMNEVELNSLLSHAEVRPFEKGKLLFLQGEVLSRYYIVLEGWVKMYTGTDSGEEAVLQMLSSGDSLMEAAIFVNMPSAVSAQAIQAATLLSLPAPIVRKYLLENRKFANNVIDGLSMRSQNLIKQIEQSRLKTATERVGWFLLRLGLDQNGGRGNSISLPYDKLTIASYLDMRPETFSRTMKKFRNKGFAIDKHTVVQPHRRALCSFCDEALSNACVYKDKEGCPGTYL